jgi:hypothetical protein
MGREIAEEVKKAKAASRNEIVWVEQWNPVHDLICLYSHASVFVCPPIYEPFGIINLEAMACGTPVVASAVGGIPELVVHGETGLLVPFEPTGAHDFGPRDPEKFAQDLAEAVNDLFRSPEKLRRIVIRCRKRVDEEKVLWGRRWCEEEAAFLAFNFGNSRLTVNLPIPSGDWRKQLDSEDQKWEGRGSLVPDTLYSGGQFSLSLPPQSFTVFSRNEEV